MSAYEVRKLAEFDVVPVTGAGIDWRPVRRTLGIRAFGINAYTADEAGKHVVEQDHARPACVALDVDEVPEHVLDEVKPVDESKIDASGRKMRQRVSPGEEVVAGCLDQLQVAVDLRLDRERGIDADRSGAGESEACAGVDADLEVGPRLVLPVDRVQDVVRLHGTCDSTGNGAPEPLC